MWRCLAAGTTLAMVLCGGCLRAPRSEGSNTSVTAKAESSSQEDVKPPEHNTITVPPKAVLNTWVAREDICTQPYSSTRRPTQPCIETSDGGEPERIWMPRITLQVERSTLHQNALAALTQLAALLKRHPEMRLNINGHYQDDDRI